MPSSTMVDVTVDVRAAEALRILEKAEKRMGYAIKNAINSTLKLVQKAEIANVKSGKFTIRKTTFIERQIAVIRSEDWATPVKLQGRIAVGQKDRLLLTQFETGGQRKPFTPGAKRVAVPITGGPARPGKTSSVPAGYMFTALNLKRDIASASLPALTKSGKPRKARRRGLDLQRHTTSGGKTQLKGTHRTFEIKAIGILQRVDKTTIKVVYAYDSDVRIEPDLRWIVTAIAIVEVEFPRELVKEVNATLAFHGF